MGGPCRTLIEIISSRLWSLERTASKVPGLTRTWPELHKGAGAVRRRRPVRVRSTLRPSDGISRELKRHDGNLYDVGDVPPVS